MNLNCGFLRKESRRLFCFGGATDSLIRESSGSDWAHMLPLSFRYLPVVVNVGTQEIIEARRYLVGEIAPNYFINKNISVGTYYLYSRGFDRDAATNGHFLTVNSSFANIKLTNQLFMRVTPQVYYLKLDAQDGFYVSSSVMLAKRNFPLSLSTIVNKIIQTNIANSKDIIWNATLVYSFSKKYLKI